MTRARIGLSTNITKPTTTKFMMAVTTNTMCQLPVASLMRLASGTRKADAPFAVYSRLRLTVANLVPNVSVQVDGNRLKISPQVRKISAANTTKAHGAWPKLPSSQYEMPPRPKAIAMVYSRPMLSEIQPNSGRAPPLQILSTMPARLNVVRPNMMIAPPTLKSLAIGASCAVTISPLADTIMNMM